MIDRKSQVVVGSQIALIFAAIAGVVLLVFFTTMSSSVNDNVDKQINIKVINALMSNFENAKLSYNQLDVAKVPLVEFKRSCDKFYLENNPGITNDYIFSPDRLKGKYFYLYSTQVKMPFYVSDVLLLSSEYINNIFLEDGSNSIFLDEFLWGESHIGFPEFRNKVFNVDSSSSDLIDLRDEMSYSDVEIRIIYFGNDLDVKEDLERNLSSNFYKRIVSQNNDIVFIHVDGSFSGGIDEYLDFVSSENEINYYKFNKRTKEFNEKGTVYSFSPETLQMAINMDSKLNFDCQMDLLRKDFLRIFEVVQKKLNYLDQVHDTHYYEFINYSLNNIRDNFDSDLDLDSSRDISDEIKSAEERQKELSEMIGNYPLVY